MEAVGQAISFGTLIIRRNDVTTAYLDGEIGMMDIENGKYYTLDEVGSYIWNLLEKPRSVKDIIATLLEEYEVDTETCQEQVLEFVNKLIKANLFHSVRVAN